MSHVISEVEVPITVLVEPAEIVSSGEGPPMSEWSSLVFEHPEENKKKARFAEGLYSPGSGEVCGKYVSLSDSQICIHPYYNFPAVLDPGIEEALFSEDEPVIYADNGQDLYLALCGEMNMCPVTIFHRDLLSNEINLKYYGVNPNGVRPMAMALQYNKTVYRLDLTDSFLNNDACYHLSQMLVINSSLKELILAGCRIGAQGIMILGSNLAVNRSLVKLDISRCCLGENGGTTFAKQISDGAGIPQVNLSNNQLGRQTAFALAEALEYCNKLTHLNLSWNNFFHAPSNIKMLSELSTSDTLKKLNLSWNAMEGERVAGQLTQILLIPKMKILNLSNNKFSDDAIAIITKALIKAKKLVTLDLSFNPLSAKGAYDVLEIMTKPRVKLVNLYLDGISVEKKFLPLLDRVKKMKSRKDFRIKHGYVLHNWTVQGPDPRRLIMQRADYLGKKDKKTRMDVALFFLKICKTNPKTIPINTLIDIKNIENAPLDDDLISELANLFPGPKKAKSKMVDVQMICEYLARIWPDRKLPPTPPPESEPEPKLEPSPPPKEGENKDAKSALIN